ncbi:MAG: 30S ribosomal protein S20 [Candidatus Aminicenantales bacterium]
MVRHQSAIRQRRRSERRRAINRRNKSLLRTQIKKLRQAIKEKNDDQARQLLAPTFSLIDKCVKKGTIHENKGSRYKSRLSKQVARLVAGFRR